VLLKFIHGEFIRHVIICCTLLGMVSKLVSRQSQMFWNPLLTEHKFAVHSSNKVDVLYLVLSKAFESLVFSKRFLKLYWFGISDNLLSVH